MNGRSKQVPGAFTFSSSRPGSSSQSSAASSSSAGALPNTAKSILPPTPPQEDTLKRNVLGRKNTKRAVTAPAADELGILMDDPKGKGKQTARLVTRPTRRSNTTPNLQHRSPPELIEISSSEDGGDGNGGDFQVAKLRKEVAELKKQLALSQQQQNKLQRSASTKVTTITLLPNEAELAKVNKELADHKQKDRQFRESLTNALQCQICADLMHKPYALNPCGHVSCLSCLQAWFKSDTDESGEAAIHVRKTCPHCRARIRTRPVQLFIVKSLVEIVDPSAHEEASSAAASVTPVGEDPWQGIFREESDNDDGDSDDDDDDDSSYIICESCGESGVDENGYCMWCGYNHDFLEEDDEDEDEVQDPNRVLEGGEDDHGEVSSDSNDLWDDTYDEEDDEEDEDLANALATHPGNWVFPQPAPPSNYLSRPQNMHLSPMQFALCARGVPFDMIAKYAMRYEPERGISARIRNGEGEMWFGWNLIGVDEFDVDGEGFVRKMLKDMEERAFAWNVTEVNGRWKACRLIRRGGREDVDWGSGIDVRLPRW